MKLSIFIVFILLSATSSQANALNLGKISKALDSAGSKARVIVDSGYRKKKIKKQVARAFNLQINDIKNKLKAAQAKPNNSYQVKNLLAELALLEALKKANLR